MIQGKDFIAFVAVVLALAGCRASPTISDSDSAERLELERQAGQLMMVGFRGPELTADIRQTLCDLHPGGVCLYAQNITGIEQVAKLNEEIRRSLDDILPPFIAIDQEGGTVVRIYDGVTVFPGNMALGATRSPRLALEAGKAIGHELRLLGFNMNLAPVLDVPENPAIASRSFGNDPRLIAELGSAFISGQQAVGMATVAKHFPGEGHSHTDSHKQLPVRWEAAATIRAELSPFCEAIDNDLDAVMTAHVATPSLTRNRFPASISSRLITGVLRNEFGFDGLILTDELEGMHSISAYGVDKAAVAAIKAGADMVFVAFSPETQKQVRDALVEAARSGQIPETRWQEALRHILALKTKRNLFDTPASIAQRLAELRRQEGRNVATQIAEQAITRLAGADDSLPLDPKGRIALITDSENLAKAIHARAPQTKVLYIDSKVARRGRALTNDIADLDRNSDVVIVAFISQQRFEIVRKTSIKSCPVIVLLMNVPGPDFLKVIPDARAVLVNYSYQPVSAEAAAVVLFDHRAAPGAVPVKMREYVRPMAKTANTR
jgi:beta-N-acetylhexosaminidase